MSSLSEHDPLNPNDPSYYAPRALRQRARPSLAQEARSEPAGSGFAPAPSRDEQLENAVSDALWSPRDTGRIHTAPAFARELPPRSALFSTAARLAVATGVVGVVALLFVIMAPAARQSDADIIRTAKNTPPQTAKADDGPKPALAEFQALLAPVSQPAADEKSELLQQFMQWRHKPDATKITR